MYDAYKSAIYYRNHCGYLMLTDAIDRAAMEHNIKSEELRAFFIRCGFEL